MFDSRSGEGTVLNWRGPLLAVGIFAVAFGTLLLMARQDESNTSDMGSSLREDPYGTSLLFDSYGGAGHQVNRSQDEDSLADQDALRTTAFFIGGQTSDDWKFEKGQLRVGEKFRIRLEQFLARGGRVVLVAPGWKLKSESQGWEVETKWSKNPDDSGPTWISPEHDAMPAGSESMYVASNAPWLETDAGWTVLYSNAVDANAKPDSPVHVHMAMRKVGSGELIAASQESFLLNEAIKTHPNPALLDFLAGGRAVVWVDETLHGLHQSEGVLWLVQRYRLQVALLLFWVTLLVLLWSMSGDLARRPTRQVDAYLMRQSEGAGVAARRLLQRSVATEKVVAECWEEFRRRSPQEAQAISADPNSAPRLTTALAQAPLPGYRQLFQLIAERRASAKGMARAHRDTNESSTSSTTKVPRRYGSHE
jgi:hypothetical protein